jgi:hypothetical protein
MMRCDLHTREGFENFGTWCSVQFKAANIRTIEARRAYQLAQIGELLYTNGNAPELAALPSRALLTMAQNANAVEDHGGAVTVAQMLPDFMKAQKIGDTAAALSELLEYGPTGDPRDRETRKADATTEARTMWKERGLSLVRGNVAKAEALAADFLLYVKAEEAKKPKKKNRRTTSRRSE